MVYEIEKALLEDFWPQKEGAGRHEYTAMFSTIFPHCLAELAPQQIEAREFMDAIVNELITYMFYLKNKPYYKEGYKNTLNWEPHANIKNISQDIWDANKEIIIPLFMAIKLNLITYYGKHYNNYHLQFPKDSLCDIMFKTHPDYYKKYLEYLDKYDFKTIQKEWKKYVNRVISEVDKGSK